LIESPREQKELSSEEEPMGAEVAEASSFNLDLHNAGTDPNPNRSLSRYPNKRCCVGPNRP